MGAVVVDDAVVSEAALEGRVGGGDDDDGSSFLPRNIENQGREVRLIGLTVGRDFPMGEWGTVGARARSEEAAGG